MTTCYSLLTAHDSLSSLTPRPQDFWGFTWDTARGFVFGCSLCFVGVYFLTKKVRIYM